MRTVFPTLWLMAFIASGAMADESTQAESDQAQVEAPESIAPESAAVSEEKADADIRQIEQGVSGTEKVEEFIPNKPLSADKAISLPSDI